LLVDRRPDPDPYKVMTDPDLRGSKTYGSGCTTLVLSHVQIHKNTL